jgi:hypothetical protein
VLGEKVGNKVKAMGFAVRGDVDGRGRRDEKIDGVRRTAKGQRDGNRGVRNARVGSYRWSQHAEGGGGCVGASVCNWCHATMTPSAQSDLVWASNMVRIAVAMIGD